MKRFLIHFILIIIFENCFAQNSSKTSEYFGEIIIADSLSTLMIPIRYDIGVFTSNKMALWNDYYANFIFYNFNSDSTTKLFEQNTFIKGFYADYYTFNRNVNLKQAENFTQKWIFYFVKNVDFDENGKIEENDPAILYVSDKYGKQLQAITALNENAVSIKIFEKQGFAMIKMQQDQNSDKDFDSDDNDFYYIKFDLTTLTSKHKIELNN